MKIKVYSLKEIGGLTAFLRKARHQYNGIVISRNVDEKTSL